MKKALYGTTALVAASVAAAGSVNAAEKIQIGVGGYYQVVMTVGEEDWDTNNFNIVQEGEIHFDGKTTLDNGLTVGVQVQLEGYTTGDQIDEHYVFLEGEWGRLNIGAENSAAYLMAYGAPTAIVGHGVDSPNFQHFSTPGRGQTNQTLNIANDANKVTYFTPRFSGFQLGVSYTPDTGDGQNCPNDALTGGYSSSYGFPTDDPCSPEEIISGGANYVNSFDGFDVAAYGGIEYAFDGGDKDDILDWQAGGQIGVSGFTVGGSYVDRDGGDWSVTGGLTYENGPWKVGVGGGYFETDQGPYDTEFQRYEVGGTYALGPGVDVSAGVFYYDVDDAEPAAGKINGQDDDSIQGAITLGLSF